MCASGYRASVATSLLGAAGFERVSWVADGVPAWQAAGYDVVTPADGETDEPRDGPIESAPHETRHHQ
jgi:hypothetical protein